MEAVDRYRKFQQDGIPDEVAWPEGVYLSPVGIPPANDAANTMLGRYCEWLNLWVKADDPNAYLYEPGSFYQREIIAAYETDSFWVVVLSVYDGDDGGPSVLTGYWDHWPASPYNDGAGADLTQMAQEFDASVQMIVVDSQFTRLPEEDK